MAKLSILALAAFVASVTAEAPGGYSYSQPSVVLIGGGGHSSGGGGHSFGGGGLSFGGGHSFGGGGLSFGGGLGGGHGGGLLGGGGGYREVHSGYQTSEGQYVDPTLLEKVKDILLREELHNSQSSSFSSGHGLSSVYGVPSSGYGVPSYHDRVVGIELGHVKQGIQVAQYVQDGGYSGGYSGGLSGGYAGGYSGYIGSGGYKSGGFSSGGSFGSLGSLGHGSGHGSISLSSGYSAPSGGGYNTIALPSGSYGVPLPSSHH